MYKYILILFAFLLVCSFLFTQNQMPLMQTMVGDYENCYFGKAMATLDFNGDGIDDLVVWSRGGSSSTNGFGKISIYYGEAVFDSIPDLTMTGEYVTNTSSQICNAGDVNRDGYDDLLIVEYPSPYPYYHAILRFYYGGTNPDLISDHEIQVPVSNDLYPEITPIECIGDINNDGYDDMGVYTRTQTDTLGLAIMLGGSFNIVPVISNVSNSYYNLITRAGDVNGDEIDDFMVGYTPNLLPQPEFPRYRYIYYGANEINLNNRVLLLESYITNQVNPGGYGIGDFNGDGFDDFMIYEVPSETDHYKKFKMGSTSLPGSLEYTVSNGTWLPNLMTFGAGRSMAYGDFNGDGFSDVVGTNYEAYNWAGISGVWLGKASPNGLYDMVINHPSTSPYHQFGWAVTAGDYNNDGYCDIAISSPNGQTSFPIYPGYVYVYAGNQQLADTTVSNDDHVATPLTDSIKLKIYPNPSKELTIEFQYQIEGAIPKVNSAMLVLYNIRGQVVDKQSLNLKDLKKQEGLVSFRKLHSAVYIAALNINGRRIASTKLTIR